MKTNPQAGHYGSEYDYTTGSPHLRHRHLYEILTTEISKAQEPIRTSGTIPSVLEIGAGDGSVSERLLATGCRVTATEMSPDSVNRVSTRFGGNDRFRAVLDETGDLRVIRGERFDLVLFASVLHHIPDYLSAIKLAADEHLKPGGSLVTIQDPPWYPRMRSVDRRISELSFLSWRLTQGHLVRGFKTRIRRATTGLSEEAPGDAVEYHVVRNGVDEQAIADLLSQRFQEVRVLRYWSTQGVVQQRFGEKLGLLNTFGLFATQRHNHSDDQPR